jgi:anti-anti-sigma regulatory factor
MWICFDRQKSHPDYEVVLMDAATIKVTMSDNGELATVIVGETLTIETCAEFKQALSNALDTALQVVLDAHQLKQVDITSLQLICSACKSASSRNRSFIFGDDIPNCIETLRTVIGANQSSLCNNKRTESCIWVGGTK